MHRNPHKLEAPVQTQGRLIHAAAFYDLSAAFMTLGRMRRLRSLTVDLARLEPGESILDVGCGTGGVTIPAKLRVGGAGRAVGIDPSPEMIAVARRKASRAGLEVDFRVGVIESLPFPDGAFDAVTSSLMMHHLPEQLRAKGLAEIRRALKPGGRLLIAEMRRPGPSLLGRLTSFVLHHGHALQFGVEDLPGLLNAAGFEAIELLDDRFLGIGFVRASRPAIA